MFHHMKRVNKGVWWRTEFRTGQQIHYLRMRSSYFQLYHVSLIALHLPQNKPHCDASALSQSWHVGHQNRVSDFSNTTTFFSNLITKPSIHFAWCRKYFENWKQNENTEIRFWRSNIDLKSVSFRAIGWNPREMELVFYAKVHSLLPQLPGVKDTTSSGCAMAHRPDKRRLRISFARIVFSLSHSKILNSFSLELLSSKEKYELEHNKKLCGRG